MIVFSNIKYKLVFLLVWITTGYLSHAQIIDIPDPNFKHVLVNTLCVDSDNNGIYDRDADVNNDGEIQLSEAESVIWSLLIHDNNITSLEGIEYFTNLKRMSCVDNLLTEIDVTQLLELERLHVGFNNLQLLDVSQNTKLKYLYCYRNQLSSLDISQNLELEELSAGYNNLSEIDVTLHEDLTLIDVQHNSLTQIDVSQNPNLDQLRVEYNELVYLNVSQNPNLRSFWCRDNQLQALIMDNGNNTNLDSFTARNNQNLFCIQVDDATYANNRICDTASNFTWCKDSQAQYSENCLFSVDEFNLTEVSLYPNPATDILNISSEMQIDFFQIYSLTGKLIKESENTQINVSKFPSGLYFAIIYIDGIAFTKKFVKS